MGAEKRKRQKAAKAAAEEAKVEAAKAAAAPSQTRKAAVKIAEVAGKGVVPAPAPVAAQSFSVGGNWKRLLEKRPTIAPKAAAHKRSFVADGGAAENYVALDCEMVGVGPGGTRSVLARLSIVDNEGKVLIDSFVRPNEDITDYRTHITGISSGTLLGPKVLSEEVARKKAHQLMSGKVVVGHAVQHDFQALLMSHPASMTRDTATFLPLRLPGKEKRTPSLARLSEVWLHEVIRPDGKHDSVEDARMALRLYRLKSSMWEKSLRRGAAAGAVAEGGDEAGAAEGTSERGPGAKKQKKRKRQDDQEPGPNQQISTRERKRRAQQPRQPA